MNILISGGTGLIGRKLTEKLISLHHSVFILSRKEISNGAETLRFIKWNGKEIPETKHSFDVLINLAGEPLMEKSWTKEQQQRLLTSRTESATAFVNYIQKVSVKPKVFISASAVGYYGNRGTEILNEESPAGKGFLAGICEEWEKAAQNSKIRTVFIRTGIVLSIEGGAFPEMLNSYGFGFGAWFGTGNQGFPWIHIEDEIGLILFAIENEKLNGALNLSGPELLSNKDFIKILGRIKKRNIAFPVPSFALEIGLGKRAEVLLDSQFVKPQKALELGYQFKFPDAESALNNLLKIRQAELVSASQ